MPAGAAAEIERQSTADIGQQRRDEISDRPGFLHDVTRALTALGLQISNAKISTYGHKVIDVFYVKDIFGLKLTEQPKRKRIRETLMAVLDDGAKDKDKKDAKKVAVRSKASA